MALLAADSTLPKNGGGQRLQFLFAHRKGQTRMPELAYQYQSFQMNKNCLTLGGLNHASIAQVC